MPLSKSNKVQLYGKKRSRFNPRRNIPSLYKKSGMNKKEAQDAKLKHLNNALRKGSFDFKGSNKRQYRNLQTKKLKREGIKNPLTRKLEGKKREHNALIERQKQLGKLNKPASNRLTKLEQGVKIGPFTRNYSLEQLAQQQAQQNINKIIEPM